MATDDPSTEQTTAPHPFGALLPIHTSRLILRAATHADIPNCLSRALDPICVQHLPHLNHQNHSAATCQKWIDFMACERHAGRALWSIVERKEDGHVIGDGGPGEMWWEDAAGKRYNAFEEGKGLRRIGEGGLMLASGEDVRGRGYAEEAMYAFFKVGFEGGEDGRGLGLDEHRCYTLKENEGFKKLARRLGMHERETVSASGRAEVEFKLGREEWLDGRKKGLWDENDVKLVR